ncbi:MAG: hypothetical protein HOC23_07825 [Halieaceae bacterium]|jgi:hypothetical protein|nr:hypothetical protein [Halieaceae bacterium]
MGLFIKFIVFLLILGLSGLFFLKRPDGNPWLSIDDFDLSLPLKDIVATQQLERLKTPTDESEGEGVTVYRWRGEDGSWQFSDVSPGPGIGEKLTVSTNTNRSIAPLADTAAKPKGDTPEQNTLNPNQGLPISPTTIPLDQIPALIEDARKLQIKLDKRHEKMEQAVQ